MTRPMPRWAGPLLGAGVVVAAMGGLHALGVGTLAAPPTTSGEDLLDWVRSTDPTTVGMVVLRLLALGVGYHLIATTALGIIGRLLRRPGLVHLAEWSTLPPFRSTVRRIAGIGLSASAALLTPIQGAGASNNGPPAHQVTAPVAAVPARQAGQATATWRRAPTGPSTATLRLVSGAPDGDPGGQATLRPVDPDPTDVDRGASGPGNTGEGDLLEERRPESSPPESASVEPGPAPDSRRHTVAPGDHLWAIAEARLADAIGRPPTDAEIDPYWRTVVAANTGLTDPDLLMPGSAVWVPAPPT